MVTWVIVKISSVALMPAWLLWWGSPGGDFSRGVTPVNWSSGFLFCLALGPKRSPVKLDLAFKSMVSNTIRLLAKPSFTSPLCIRWSLQLPLPNDARLHVLALCRCVVCCWRSLQDGTIGTTTIWTRTTPCTQRCLPWASLSWSSPSVVL